MPFKEINVNNANAIRAPQAIPCPEATDLDPDYHPCAKTNRQAVLLIAILGSSLAFMDGSIVNVALPTLQRAFHAGASSVQWVVQSYALFSAALLLFSGALGDQFGRKKIQKATGRLIANAQRQLRDCINRPPATGPRAAKTLVHADQVPMAAARSSVG